MATIEQALQALGAKGWVIIGDSIYANIQWADQPLFTEQEVNAKIAELGAIKKPDPKGFYEKLLDGESALYLVYQYILGLNLTGIQSVYLTAFSNALVVNDWTKPYARPAFTTALSLISTLIDPEEIETVESEARAFGLID